MQIALGSALAPQQQAQQMPHVQVGQPQIQAQPHVEVGQPQIQVQPHPHVAVGMPTQEHTPHIAVAIGEPELPANPAHHGPYKAQAANLLAYGRRAGWRPQELASALEHVRNTYNSGSY